jgi:hypothetical protein
MEEKMVPWWRKALKFALSGIRRGLGLFSRAPENELKENEPDESGTGKNVAVDEPADAGLKENPPREAVEETDLNKNSPLQEHLAAEAERAEAAALPLGIEEPAAEHEAQACRS